jgi:hypothetical protein
VFVAGAGITGVALFQRASCDTGVVVEPYTQAEFGSRSQGWFVEREMCRRKPLYLLGVGAR